MSDMMVQCVCAVYVFYFVGRGGALVEAMTFNWRVGGSTPTLAAR